MNSIFAKRRARLLAMKAIRDNYVPGGKLVACPKCGQDSERRQVAQGLSVCPKCGYHWPIGAHYRLSTVLDPGTFRELNEKLPAGDPLSFPGYGEKLRSAQRKTGMNEAAVTAAGAIGGCKCVVGVLDSRFLMGSMSAAVGEKITLAVEYAAKNKLPLILFAASGGARMQEGILSLMQ
ncbi:MAG: carboxyl transferase domain-containing protein, partial [Oscillospiraceae bacterium]|nr:carboxyl transferase domain-containing protein [Oscillospiraceae bacterium]